jgi:hypothetical protein
MIDFGCAQLTMRSFADVGDVWNVDGESLLSKLAGESAWS